MASPAFFHDRLCHAFHGNVSNTRNEILRETQFKRPFLSKQEGLLSDGQSSWLPTTLEIVSSQVRGLISNLGPRLPSYIFLQIPT